MKNKIILLLIAIFMILICIEIYSNLKPKIKENQLTKPIDYNYKNEIEGELTKNNNYLGYLKIDKLNINKPILYDTTDDVLDQNVLGLHKMSVSLDDKIGNVIIAGHNNKYVFGNLYKIKLNDKINIITKDNTYTFKVTKKDIVNSNDFKYFIVEDKKKIITLITCYGNDKRLFVMGEEV